jgi:dihydroorotate dehydrogenase electron transfer subunit
MESCQNLVGMVRSAVHCHGRVVQIQQVARDTYRCRIECPEVARQIHPGQFFMLRDPRITDPLLGRPFALLDTYENADGQLAGIDFGFVVVGKMTKLMTSWAVGDSVELWGPLGNGFPIADARRLFLIGGGIGITPFRAVAQEALGLKNYSRIAGSPLKDVTVLYGARSREHLGFEDDFNLPGATTLISTDDGSCGHSGFVTQLLEQAYDSATPPDAIFCCGPEPMMAAVSKVAAPHGTPCWLSLETPMACGIGICFSCVTKVRMDDGNWDYRRTCVEGPVFLSDNLCL